MKILTQIIKKKLDLSEEYMLNRSYVKAIWQFYCCYNLAVSILNIKQDPHEIIKLNKFWKKLLFKNIDEKKLKKIHFFMNRDRKVIIQALNFIDKQVDKMAYEMGDIDKPDVVAILSYEFPE